MLVDDFLPVYDVSELTREKAEAVR